MWYQIYINVVHVTHIHKCGMSYPQMWHGISITLVCHIHKCGSGWMLIVKYVLHVRIDVNPRE